jgi:hypothetical protein
MADDPPPPQDFWPKFEKADALCDPPPNRFSPPDLRQSALRDLAQARDNRVLFIEAMVDPLRRGIAFDVVERNCRERFAEGEDGIKLYRLLLGYVRLSDVSEAVEEFEHRFEPMLDQDLWKMARQSRRPQEEA